MARFRRASRNQDDDLPPQKITRQSLREAYRLAAYLRPYWLKFVAALIALTLSSVLGLAFPFVAGQLVNAALPGRPADASLIAAWGVNTIALVLMGVLACQATAAFTQSILFTEVGERALTDLRRDAYARLIHLSMTFHVQRRVGEMSSRIAADVSQIEDTVVAALPQFLRQSTMLVGSILLIAVTSARLTLVMLSVFPALIGIAVIFGRLIRRNSKEAQDRLADGNVIVEETLHGIASVKAFANEDYEQDRYHRALDRFLKEVLRGAKYRGGFFSFIIFALFGALVLVLWYGFRLVQANQMSLGALASFMLYTLYAAGAMGSFAELYSQMQRALGATHRVRELLEEKTEDEICLAATRQGSAWKMRSSAGSRLNGVPVPQRLRGDMAFENVTFRYPSRPDVVGAARRQPGGASGAAHRRGRDRAAPANRRWFRCCCASTNRKAAASSSTAAMRAIMVCANCDLKWRLCRRTCCCSAARFWTTSLTAGLARPRRRSWKRLARPTRTTLSVRFLRAIRRASANAAFNSPAVNGSAWPSLALFCAIRPSSSSTKRPARSIQRARAWFCRLLTA